MPNLTTGFPWPPGEAFNIPRNDSGIGHDLPKLSSEAVLSFTEVDGYREHFADGDTQATRMFDVPWSQRLAFVQYMLGYATVQPQQGLVAGGGQLGGKISRVIPAQHPQLPYLYATRCELQNGIGAIADDPGVVAVDAANNVVLRPGFPLRVQAATEAGESVLVAGGEIPGPVAPAVGAGAIPVQMIRYYDSSTGNDGFARYAVTYGVLPYEVRGDADLANLFGGNELARYVEREFSFAASNLPLPTGSVVFGNEAPANVRGKSIGQQGNILILGTITCQYTWHQVPDLPVVTMVNAAVGFVNSDAFDGFSGFPTWQPGTLLCMAPRTPLRYRGSTGRIYWKLNFNLIYRPQGWNFFPAADGKFYPIYIANPDGTPSAQRVYASTSFGALFQAPLPITYQ